MLRFPSRRFAIRAVFGLSMVEIVGACLLFRPHVGWYDGSTQLMFAALTHLPAFLLLQSVAPGLLLLSPLAPWNQLSLPWPVLACVGLIITVMCAFLHWAAIVYLAHRSIRDRSVSAFGVLSLELAATSWGAIIIAAT
jgi:hypothetical protein